MHQGLAIRVSAGQQGAEGRIAGQENIQQLHTVAIREYGVGEDHVEVSLHRVKFREGFLDAESGGDGIAILRQGSAHQPVDGFLIFHQQNPLA